LQLFLGCWSLGRCKLKAQHRATNAPGPTTVVHASPGQLKLNEQGDYYVGDKMILNKRRMEALKKCTHNQAFESDRYVACMAKEGQAP
jgi:hypothetical protein